MIKVINVTFEKTKEITNRSKTFSKKFLRKKAIKRVYETIAYQQKKPSDYTKEELRNFILKEEKNILQRAGWKGAIVTIGAMFGITNL